MNHILIPSFISELVPLYGVALMVLELEVHRQICFATHRPKPKFVTF